jgi:hypothetical protein
MCGRRRRKRRKRKKKEMGNTPKKISSGVSSAKEVSLVSAGKTNVPSEGDDGREDPDDGASIADGVGNCGYARRERVPVAETTVRKTISVGVRRTRETYAIRGRDRIDC